jgi:hypothetical protein
MFFKNAQKNSLEFIEGLFHLVEILIQRYFHSLFEIWKSNRRVGWIIYFGLFVLFVSAFSICSIVFKSKPIELQTHKTIPYSRNSNVRWNYQTDKYDKNSDVKFETLDINTSDPSTKFRGMENMQQNSPIDNLISDQAYRTVDVLKGIVTGFKPLLDSFISKTPDVSGESTNEISFSSGKFPTAKEFSNKLLQLIIPIYVVFIALEGIRLIKNANTNKQIGVNQILWKHISCVLMLIITPIILSYSILGVNAFSNSMLGGKDLTSFLIEFLNTLQRNYSKNDSAFTTITSGLSALSSPITTFIDAFIAGLAFLPIILIAVLYLLIIGQFIIRFIKLYFLAAIYPLIAIFYSAPFEQSYTKSYWESWTKTVLHQAFFIFGYAIVQSFLLQMLNQGSVGLEQIVIFIGSLLFLYNINMFTSEILGTALSRGGNLLNTFAGDVIGGSLGGFGAAGILRSVSFATNSKGFDMSQGVIGNNFAKSNSFQGFKGESKSKSLHSNLKSLPRSSKPGVNQSSGGNVALLDPTQSKQAQAFMQQGFEVSPVNSDEGIIGLKGEFYAHDQKGGVTSLYSNRADAVEDKVPINELYQISGNYNVQDTTNYGGREMYEQRTGVELGVNATDTNMKQNLQNAQYENVDKGIDGITTTQVSKSRLARMKLTGERINEQTPRIQKTIVYTSKINKPT